MIFVFGSNLAGIHGAGAARCALLYEGAVMAQGIGRMGNSYGIPTKDWNIESMKLEEIQYHVDAFIGYALRHPGLVFKVTQIGCGLAGFKPHQIAPMFKAAPDNCLFDEAWAPWLKAGYNYWGTKS